MFVMLRHRVFSTRRTHYCASEHTPVYWGHVNPAGLVTRLAWFHGPPSSRDGVTPASGVRPRQDNSAPTITDPSDPDVALLMRIRDGDETAFAALFTKYVESVVAFAYRYVGSIDTARDVTQEIFIRVWERRSAIPLSGIRAYLFRAARNRALDLLGHEAIVVQWQAASRASVGDGILGVPNAGEQRIETDETATRVAAALATLTPRGREIVRLVREDGLKPGEVAALLGLTPATVYVHLSRALKQLAEQLRD